MEDVEEKCRVEMWRCLSKVVEEGLHYMDKPDGLLGLAKKTMFKMAFHGGLSNVWSGVMTIPEVTASLKLHTDVACTLQIKPPAFSSGMSECQNKISPGFQGLEQ